MYRIALLVIQSGKPCNLNAGKSLTRSFSQTRIGGHFRTTPLTGIFPGSDEFELFNWKVIEIQSPKLWFAKIYNGNEIESSRWTDPHKLRHLALLHFAGLTCPDQIFQ
jgi:hypothetical protein